MIKPSWRFALGTAGVLGIAFLAFRGSSTGTPQPEPMPLILKQVQSIGELHAARFTYEQVFEQATSRQPEEWTRYMPGLSNMVTASTRNSALVSATAQVEAGVDLSKATYRQSGTTKQLVLPRPLVYRPQVDMKLHSVRRGLFWRDDNIALSAIHATQARVREAARKQGIVEEAERNITTRLGSMVAGLGVNDVQVVFE